MKQNRTCQRRELGVGGGGGMRMMGWGRGEGRVEMRERRPGKDNRDPVKKKGLTTFITICSLSAMALDRNAYNLRRKSRDLFSCLTPLAVA